MSAPTDDFLFDGRCVGCGKVIDPLVQLCKDCHQTANEDINRNRNDGDPSEVNKNDFALYHGYVTDEAEDIEAFGGEGQ